MKQVYFWSAPIGTIFISNDWLYKKTSELSGTGFGHDRSMHFNPNTEIVPIIEEDFIVMKAIAIEETL